MPGGHRRICSTLHAGGVPMVPAGHVFFGVSIFFCGSTHLLPVQVQPFFPQSVAGFDGSTQILPFQVQPFFRQSTAGFDGSTHLLPVQVHPFFLQSSAGRASRVRSFRGQMVGLSLIGIRL